MLQPFARGLDTLQGEDKYFYGMLLPTLETVLKKIKDIKANLSVRITGLAFSIEEAINMALGAFLIQKKQFLQPLLCQNSSCSG